MSTKATSKCFALGFGANDEACKDEYGPEWQYAGKDEMCTLFTYSALCRWTGHSASAYDCCLGNNTYKRTCDDKYKLSNPACDATMQQYCAEGDRIMNDSKCIQWCNLRPDACKASRASFCIKHLDQEACRTWCNANENYESCMTGVQTYCDLHPDDDYCACLKSKILNTDMGINPKCVDERCLRHGFMSQNMRNTPCPDIINCDIQYKMYNTGLSLMTSIPIEQDCGKESPDTGTKDVGGGSEGVNNNLQNILIFIMVVFIALAIYFIFDDDDEEAEGASGAWSASGAWNAY